MEEVPPPPPGRSTPIDDDDRGAIPRLRSLDLASTPIETHALHVAIPRRTQRDEHKLRQGRIPWPLSHEGASYHVWCAEVLALARRKGPIPLHPLRLPPLSTTVIEVYSSLGVSGLASTIFI